MEKPNVRGSGCAIVSPAVSTLISILWDLTTCKVGMSVMSWGRRTSGSGKTLYISEPTDRRRWSLGLFTGLLSDTYDHNGYCHRSERVRVRVNPVVGLLPLSALPAACLPSQRGHRELATPACRTSCHKLSFERTWRSGCPAF